MKKKAVWKKLFSSLFSSSHHHSTVSTDNTPRTPPPTSSSNPSLSSPVPPLNLSSSPPTAYTSINLAIALKSNPLVERLYQGLPFECTAMLRRVCDSETDMVTNFETALCILLMEVKRNRNLHMEVMRAYTKLVEAKRDNELTKRQREGLMAVPSTTLLFSPYSSHTASTTSTTTLSSISRCTNSFLEDTYYYEEKTETFAFTSASNSHIISEPQMSDHSSHVMSSTTISVPIPIPQPAEIQKDFIRENPDSRLMRIKKIGQGGFGEVFFARDTERDCTVAVKVLRNGFDRKQAQITNEIYVHKSCKHPNIITYYDTYLYENRVYMILEFCRGGTLSQLASDHVLTEPEIAFLCRNVLNGLVYLHEKKFIHRDLKSENVLLNLEGDVKIIDMGLCAILGPGQTTTRGVVGSKYWMAPEVIKRKHYSNKVDVWSVGLLCYEMMHQVFANFQYKSWKAAYRTATRGAPAILAPEKWSDTLVDFVEQCLFYCPKARPSAVALLDHPFMKTQESSKAEMIKLFETVFIKTAPSSNGHFTPGGDQ